MVNESDSSSESYLINEIMHKMCRPEQNSSEFGKRQHCPNFGKSDYKFRSSYKIDCNLAAVSVFFKSIAMVMGPTPPGTGVMAEAISCTAS